LSGHEFDVNQRQFDVDLNDLKRLGKKQFNDYSKINGQHRHILSDDILEELCRYGASEIHSIAAFVGGCCAQEAIKLITHQYIPIDNTLIYNGIEQTTTVVKLSDTCTMNSSH
jgi:NEDD8-activating enzyme E1 regulatory subunit